jgi:4-amino-4-deoxy-L-arabinose transferase-like glycosyltransferase
MRDIYNSALRARSAFWLTFWLTLALKVVLAASFPLTSDEAFFVLWGHYPDWGYSDHPPMVGWWLSVLLQLGDHPLILRSATLLLSSLIALGVVDVALRHLPSDREAAAWWAGAVYLAMPWSWMLVLVTTDTPLIFFMALSAWCFLRAEAVNAAAKKAVLWYSLAGLFVGLAFLSKYFAALLGLAYAVYILGWRRDRWWALPLMFLFALPSIAVNLLFNAHHGWANIMFNFFNRNESSQWQWESFVVYLVMLAYLFTPWLWWHALMGRGGRMQAAEQGSLYGSRDGAAATRRSTATAVAVLWLFPLLVFAVLGLRRSVGLHWVLGFVPLFVLWAALRVDAATLRRSYRWTLALSFPHLLLVAGVVWAPLAWWQNTQVYDKAVFLHEARAVTVQLQQNLPEDALLMAHAYSPAAILSYFSQRYVPVYGVGRHYAREDDLRFDFRAWDGRAVRVFFRSPVNPEDHAAFFQRVSVSTFHVAGVTYYQLDGEGFRYQAYRDSVLSQIAEQFHHIPPWLPLKGSPFCERYGFQSCSPPR